MFSRAGIMALFKRRKPAPEKAVLYVMHRDDMARVHPQTDWSFTCDICGNGVGIYPSGQAAIKRYGRNNTSLRCNRCEIPSKWELTPEIQREMKESVWRT